MEPSCGPSFREQIILKISSLITLMLVIDCLILVLCVLYNHGRCVSSFPCRARAFPLHHCVTMSSPSADRAELFQSIGLSESKAKETAKNQTVSDSLVLLVNKVLAIKQLRTPSPSSECALSISVDSVCSVLHSYLLTKSQKIVLLVYCDPTLGYFTTYFTV